MDTSDREAQILARPEASSLPSERLKNRRKKAAQTIGGHKSRRDKVVL